MAVIQQCISCCGSAEKSGGKQNWEAEDFVMRILSRSFFSWKFENSHSCSRRSGASDVTGAWKNGCFMAEIGNFCGVAEWRRRR